MGKERFMEELGLSQKQGEMNRGNTYHIWSHGQVDDEIPLFTKEGDKSFTDIESQTPQSTEKPLDYYERSSNKGGEVDNINEEPSLEQGAGVGLSILFLELLDNKKIIIGLVLAVSIAVGVYFIYKWYASKKNGISQSKQNTQTIQEYLDNV